MTAASAVSAAKEAATNALQSFGKLKLSRRIMYAVAVVSAALVFILSLRLIRIDSGRVAKMNVEYEPYDEEALLNLSHLDDIKDLSKKFLYTRRVVIPKFYKGQRPDLTAVRQNLFSVPPAELSRSNLKNASVPQAAPLELDIPRSITGMDKSVLTIGIATTLERFIDALPNFMHWLANTGVEMVIVSPPHSNWTNFSKYVSKLGIRHRLVQSDRGFVSNYLRGVQIAGESAPTHVKYFLFVDDDTWFVSLDELTAHLQENYDAKVPQMIGSLSEDEDQISHVHRELGQFGMVTYGGGGIVVTRPLLMAILEPGVWKHCRDIDRGFSDHSLYSCVLQYTRVRPRHDFTLHQVDLRGDLSGLFESGRWSLSLHHWRSWYSVDVPQMSKVSQVCGSRCIFQRFRFTDGVVLSNGYSAVKYPNDLTSIDLAQMEATWNGNENLDRFALSFGPLRSKMPEKEKVSFLHARTAVTENGVLQTYIKKGTIDEVLEIEWLS